MYQNEYVALAGILFAMLPFYAPEMETHTYIHTYTHTYIHTYMHIYINEFITHNTVKQSWNQRYGQSLGGGRLGDEGIKIK